MLIAAVNEAGRAPKMAAWGQRLIVRKEQVLATERKSKYETRSSRPLTGIFVCLPFAPVPRYLSTSWDMVVLPRLGC